jgi:hypothetical protein
MDDEHLTVIMNCAKKFPELRFGQFIMNAVNSSEVTRIVDIYYWTDRDIADRCKQYCIVTGR